MNEAEIKKDMKTQFKILKLSAEIYEEALRLAIEIVDTKMSFSEVLKQTMLQSERNIILMDRERSISAVVANILSISDDVRI